VWVNMLNMHRLAFLKINRSLVSLTAQSPLVFIVPDPAPSGAAAAIVAAPPLHVHIAPVDVLVSAATSVCVEPSEQSELARPVVVSHVHSELPTLQVDSGFRHGTGLVDLADAPVGAPAAAVAAAPVAAVVVVATAAGDVAAEPVGVNPEHVHVGLVDGLQAELVDEDVDLNPVDVDRRM
jgi:hypothetical protein